MRRAIAFTCAVALASLPVSARGQAPERRRVAVVFQLSGNGIFGDAARFETATLGTWRRDVDAMLHPDFVDVPFALAIPGVVCDELRLSRHRHAQPILRGLRRLAQSRPVLTTTYTEARIDGLGAKRLRTELEDGSASVRKCLGRAPIDVLSPPDGVLPDERGLDELADAGIERSLSAFAVAASPRGPKVTPSVAFVPPTVEDVVAVRPEAPALAVVVGEAARLRDLVGDDRLDITTIDGLRGVDLRTGSIPPTVTQPSPRARSALERSADALEVFRSVTYDGNRIADVFRVRQARSEQHALDGDSEDRRAAAMPAARTLEQDITEQFRLWSLQDGSVTFTSRRGSVPLTVTNRASYAIRVRVTASSPKVDFPKGRTVVRRIEPPGDTITFDANARSSGTFPVAATLRSPDRRVTFDTAELSVRSTAANLPALILTGGGALFLLVVFGRRLGRRRRSAP